MQEKQTDIEQIMLKIENLIGTTNICISAFSHKDAFDIVNPGDIVGAFETINNQLDLIKTDINEYMLGR